MTSSIRYAYDAAGLNTIEPQAAIGAMLLGDRPVKEFNLNFHKVHEPERTRDGRLIQMEEHGSWCCILEVNGTDLKVLYVHGFDKLLGYDEYLSSPEVQREYERRLMEMGPERSHKLYRMMMAHAWDTYYIMLSQ